MSVTLRSATGVVEVHWWWEDPREGRRPLPFHDRAYARSFLARLGDRPANLAALRRFALERLSTPAVRFEDGALLDELSWWVLGGRVRLATHLPDLRTMTTAPPEAAVTPAPWHAAAALEPEAAEVASPPSLSPGVDAAAQATTLRQAAVHGAAFCEECARAKAASAAAGATT